jgi:Notch-like protein
MSNSQNIADFLNKFFLYIVDNNIKNNSITSNKPLHYLRQAFNNLFRSIKYHVVTTSEIAEIIKFLKLKGSHGYDEIPAKILKFSSPFIASPLAYISNKMLSTGIFPDRLKYAEMKPLFKDGCKNDPFNYRPISLVTTFSKIFENIILFSLNQHAADHDIFVSEQFGFRCQSSINKASYILINEILEAMNNQKIVGSEQYACKKDIYFDLVCCTHNILLLLVMVKLRFI